MNTTTTPPLCVVTGASSGIGRATAEALAAVGAHVVMLCYDEDGVRRAREAIIAATGNRQVDAIPTDLRSFASVRDAAATIHQRYGRVDVLINNAGVIRSERTTTEEGVEETFAVNHLGHFQLTNELLDLLRKSAPARIINVSSSHHKAGRMDFDDLQGEVRYDQNRAYCQSKLANVLFTYELARRLDDTGVTVNCVHPGAVRTNFSSGLTGMWATLWKLTDPLRRPPERAAADIAHLASAPELAWTTGTYFVKRKPANSSKASNDIGAATRLWDISDELICRIAVERTASPSIPASPEEPRD